MPQSMAQLNGGQTGEALLVVPRGPGVVGVVRVVGIVDVVGVVVVEVAVLELEADDTAIVWLLVLGELLVSVVEIVLVGAVDGV